MKSVPDGSGDESSARRVVTIEKTPVQPEPVQQGDETDYDAIRRKIAEYKQKIKDLEKLLPNKK